MNQVHDLPWLDYGFDFNASGGHVSSVFGLPGTQKWSFPSSKEGHHQMIHVAAAMLDYAFGVIEGFQVFRWQDGSCWAFRPFANHTRLNQGAMSENLGMPTALPKEIFWEGLKRLVEINLGFIPSPQACLEGASFYVRPKILGVSGQYRVRFPDLWLFSLSGSPVGPYWKTGFKPNQLLWWPNDPRSMPAVKWPGNYTPTGVARNAAAKAGCSAPLFSIHEKATETHAAAFCALIDGVLVVRNDSHVLSSITLNSLTQLCQDEGIEVRESNLRQRDLAAATEMAAVGTAAGIQPIDAIKRRVLRRNNEFEIIDLGTPRIQKGVAGPFANKMSKLLWAIKTGQETDVHGWMKQVA